MACDLHVDASSQIKLHERVDRLLRGFQNIDQALVRPDLELFPRFLVRMGRTQNAVPVDSRGKRDRAGDPGPCPAGRFYSDQTLLRSFGAPKPPPV